MNEYMSVEQKPVHCIKPSVEYIPYRSYSDDDIKHQSFNVSHISKCARVCYGKENRESNLIKDLKTFQSLIHNEHLSMLRHDSFYYAIDISAYHPENMMHIVNVFFDNNPFVSYGFADKESILADRNILLVSTNGQFIYEKGKEINRLLNHYGFPPLSVFRVTLDDFKRYTDSENLIRHTVAITTNIGVTRELNRVSPNNIAESSTRYIIQSNKDVVGTICLNKTIRTSIYPDDPDWFDYEKAKIASQDCLLCLSSNNHRPFPVGGGETNLYYDALIGYRDALITYNKLVDKRVPLDIARNNLPLTTASKVVYTYTLAEWKHIIDIRYHGTTGKPHPDTKEVAGMIRNLFIDMNIDIDKR